MKKGVFNDNIFYVPVLVMGAVLFLRLYYLLVNIFSGFANISDLKLHSTWIFFLAKYGLYGTAPNWWNGFLPFSTYPPGFSFFSLLWYYITGDPFHAAFFSVVQLLLLGLIFIFCLGKLNKFSKLGSLAFFLFLFANPQITDYLKIGRYPELLGWVFFIAFACIVFWYKDHQIDKKFLLIIPAYSSIILTHIYPAYMASLLMLCLFLVKKNKERMVIMFSFLLILIITSFWWIPFLRFVMSRSYSYAASYELLGVNSIISYNTLFLVLFLFVFYFYYKGCKDKKRELLFFSPLILLNFIVLSRLIVLIPVLKDIFVSPYNLLFLFLIIFLLFKTESSNYPGIVKRRKFWVLILISISYLVILLLHTPDFTPRTTDTRLDMLSILPYVEGRYIIIPDNSDVINPDNKHDGLVLSFATVYYNLSTPFGSSYHPNTIPENMLEPYKGIYGCPWLSVCDVSKLKKIDCGSILSVVEKQNVKSLLSSNKGCDLLKRCGLKEKITKGHACLFFYG